MIAPNDINNKNIRKFVDDEIITLVADEGASKVILINHENFMRVRVWDWTDPECSNQAGVMTAEMHMRGGKELLKIINESKEGLALDVMYNIVDNLPYTNEFENYTFRSSMLVDDIRLQKYDDFMMGNTHAGAWVDVYFEKVEVETARDLVGWGS